MTILPLDLCSVFLHSFLFLLPFSKCSLTAKSLLVQSDLPISVIAERTGFGDDAYFCKMFRESTGATPRAFREKGGEIQ